MQAIIIAIGDELTLGQTVDTNSAWTAAQLAALGVYTHQHLTVADDLSVITAAIAWAIKQSELLIVSGGLGPTEDDLTRQAVADALGQPLTEDPSALASLKQWFDDRGREMPQRNRVQALIPQGANAIDNPRGTAPGIHATTEACHLFCVPGVPREMQGMIQDVVIPHVQQHNQTNGQTQVIRTTKINTFGTGESNVAELLGDQLMHRDRNPTVGTTVANGLCSVRIRSQFTSIQQADTQLQDTIKQVQERLGSLVFGRDESTLQEATVQALIDANLTVATAESCTGGRVAGMLTDVPGSSAVVQGGWVVYSNAMKQSQLNVPPELLDGPDAPGAVSVEVAVALADAARNKADADLAISLTGIAGPGGGTPDKPVGTVYMGLAQTDQPTTAWLLNLKGQRQTIRDRAAKCALQAMRLCALGQPLVTLDWATPVANPTKQPAS